MNWLPFGKRKQTLAAPQSPAPAENLPGVGAGKRILVVDDDAVIIKTTCAKLKSRGYEVVTASDASEAMSAVRQHRPDLILLDICFPPDVGIDWDGFKIMTWLQRVEEAKSVPIIIVSGSEPERYRDRCLASGATAFFYKPVDYDELLPFLAKVLEGATEQSAAAACVAK